MDGLLRLPTRFISPHGPAWRATLLLFVLHALLGAGLGLSVDEAHYALYAAHPALSYFDHPPLVGWVQWPLVALGAPVLLLRLLPGLLWLLAMALVYDITLHVQHMAGATVSAGHKAARWALAVALLAPLLHVLAIGLVPDTLLMVLHLLLMRQSLRMAAQDAAPGLRSWLLLGLLLGLAGLGKYTAIFSALAVAVLLLRAHGLRMLASAGPWLAVALGLLLVLPVLLWNAQNHWISFAYQAQHGAGGTWQVLHVLRFVLVQLLAYGLLLLWAGAGWRSLPAGTARWSLVFFALPFGVLALLSGGGTSLPHWTAPACLALMPFAGSGLAHTAAPLLRRLRTTLVALQALACVALPLLMLSAGMPFMAGKVATADASDPPNPFADLHGWDAAGRMARTLAQQHDLGSVAVQNWTLASRLGWYARPLPVHVLEDRFDQFTLWAGPLPVGASTLLVDWSQMSYELPVGPQGFARCAPLGSLPVQRWGEPLAEFRFYACQGWGGKPQPRLREGSTQGAGG
jgi:4-amino-4-deoxy-L-arabinose transferase-like glycosyltransferase